MKTIKVWSDSPSEKQLEEVCGILESGGIAILPTDTLYGICCDALNSKAIDKICRLKDINPDKSNLSIICSNISMASEYSKITDKIFSVIKNNTPGAFTFLIKSASSLPKVFKGRKTVGIRIPNNNTVRMLAERLGRPLMTTSVEHDDDDYAMNPELIAESFSRDVDIMIIGEDADIIPSTIVDCTQDIPEIIREGKGELS